METSNTPLTEQEEIETLKKAYKSLSYAFCFGKEEAELFSERAAKIAYHYKQGERFEYFIEPLMIPGYAEVAKENKAFREGENHHTAST